MPLRAARMAWHTPPLPAACGVEHHPCTAPAPPLPLSQELFDKALMNVILPYLKVSPEARSSAAAYTTEGIDVQVPEGLAAAAAAPGSGGPAATTWGFAASGLAAAGAGAGHGAGAGAPAGPEPGEEEVDEGVPAKPTA